MFIDLTSTKENEGVATLSRTMPKFHIFKSARGANYREYVTRNGNQKIVGIGGKKEHYGYGLEATRDY